MPPSLRALGLLAGLELGLVAIGLARGGEPAPAAEIERSTTPNGPEAILSQATPARMPSPAQLAAQLIARPLFTPGRRPPLPERAVAEAPHPLPKLSGIVTAQHASRAIFTTNEPSTPTSAGQGDHVGAYLVTAIGSDQVELDGPTGHWTLRPGADPDLRVRLAWLAPPRPLVDPDRREAETETDQ